MKSSGCAIPISAGEGLLTTGTLHPMTVKMRLETNMTTKTTLIYS